MTLMDNATDTVSDAVLSSERLLYSPERSRTFSGVPADHAPAEAIALPLTGEAVTVRSRGDAVNGVWLALTVPTVPNAPVVAVWLYHDGRAVKYLCDIGSIDIRHSLRSPAPDDPLITAQYGALARMAENTDAAEQAQRCREQEHRQEIESLVADAHRYAEDNNLCGEFDRFMEAHGLAPRAYRYSLTVDVTTTVTLDRTACSEDDAESAIDTEALADELGLDPSAVDTWSVSDVSCDGLVPYGDV